MAASEFTPLDVFRQAEAFYQAIDQLHRTSSPQRISAVVIPIVVLSAFASELFLKCLLSIETGHVDRTHLLWDLFQKLSPATQARLCSAWDENQAGRVDVLDKLDQSNASALPRDLPSCLEAGSDAFRLMRYIYEGGRDFAYVLSDFPIVGRKVTLELKPEWASV